MLKVFSAVSVLVVAAGSQAAPFALLSYEAGGGLPGITGDGFAVSSGGFFTGDGIGTGVGAGGPGVFNAGNYGEFDSHFALDQRGPAARNRTTGTANNSNLTLNFYGRSAVAGNAAEYDPAGAVAADHVEGEAISGYSFIQGPGSHVGLDGGDQENLARAGVGVAPPPVESGFAPNATGGRSAFDGIFIARFTVQSGATLSGAIFTTTSLGGSQSDDGTLVLGGPAVEFQTTNGAQLLALRAYLVGSVEIDAASAATSAGINDGEAFGAADVYDIWVQVVPTPGALALFGIGGIAAIRRRRA